MWVPLETAEILEEDPEGLITSTIILSHAVLLLLTFSHDSVVEFSRGYKTCSDAIILKARGVCPCVYLCFDNVSILISNKVTINKPSQYKQKPILEFIIVFKNLQKYWN